jgi:hypothetical protein
VLRLPQRQQRDRGPVPLDEDAAREVAVAGEAQRQQQLGDPVGVGRHERDPLEDRAVSRADRHRRRPLDQERQGVVVRLRADVADAPLEELAVGGAARPGDGRVGLEPGRLQRRTRLVEVVDRDGPGDRAACRADAVEPGVGLVRPGRDQLDVGGCGSADEDVLGADGVRSPARGGDAGGTPPRRRLVEVLDGDDEVVEAGSHA